MKKSVIIIGGGMAGLAAAENLLQHGVAVTLLEAKARLGGRIHTLHDANFPVELGAEFVHGKSRPLLELIRTADASCQAVANKNQLLVAGQLQTQDLWKITGEVFEKINPQQPDCSFSDFLDQQNLDPALDQLCRSFVAGFDAAYPEKISAHALLKAEQSAGEMQGAEQFRVHEGYSALIQFLMQKIIQKGGQLRTNTIVQRVDWESGQVRIWGESGGEEELFESPQALITLPLGVLKMNTVQFTPALRDKQAAAQEMPLGNVIRILFQFRKAFWEEWGFVHALSEKIPTWWDDPRGPILTGWAGGPKADALQHLTQAELENLGLDILSRIFSHPLNWLREQFVRSYFYNWAADPHIGGAYSYIPVNGLDLPPRLAAPVENTLFFAGEATVSDAQMGTVFGALETGLRAAREILAS